MKFSDFILVDSIIARLNATTKEGVVREMVTSMSKAGGFGEENVDEIVEAVLEREKMGSTGVGHMVAVPHAKGLKCLDRMIGTVAIAPDGVDFESLDGNRACLFILVVSPAGMEGEHVKAMQYTAKYLNSEEFRSYLRQSRDENDIVESLKDADDGFIV